MFQKRTMSFYPYEKVSVSININDTIIPTSMIFKNDFI